VVWEKHLGIVLFEKEKVWREVRATVKTLEKDENA
jgi:hypothetical protein